MLRIDLDLEIFLVSDSQDKCSHAHKAKIILVSRRSRRAHPKENAEDTYTRRQQGKGKRKDNCRGSKEITRECAERGD